VTKRGLRIGALLGLLLTVGTGMVADRISVSSLEVSASAVQDPLRVTSQDAPLLSGWGGSHAGQPPPDYLQGDECLFCHRNEIGPGWARDRHARTIRYREAAPEIEPLLAADPLIGSVAGEVEFVLGAGSISRLLKRDGYGRFAIFTQGTGESAMGAIPPAGERRTNLSGGPSASGWDRQLFFAQCAGCHTTAVDTTAQTFSAFSLDCYSCHGNVSLDHTTDKSRVLLSSKGRREEPRVVTSLCAQCHLRGAVSRSTGLPYPNNFIAGDNLFLDLVADFARAEDPTLNVGDRHVWRNVRDVVLDGQTTTCLSCHQMHPGSTLRHRRLLRAPICAECHTDPSSFKTVLRPEVHSPLCQY
jgi:hypothetical protein